MTKKTLQANKIVDKATSVFGDAITEVEKANDILASDIENDRKLIETSQTVIKTHRTMIDEHHDNIATKQKQMMKNADLIKQLKRFAN